MPVIGCSLWSSKFQLGLRFLPSVCGVRIPVVCRSKHDCSVAGYVVELLAHARQHQGTCGGSVFASVVSA